MNLLIQLRFNARFAEYKKFQISQNVYFSPKRPKEMQSSVQDKCPKKNNIGLLSKTNATGKHYWFVCLNTRVDNEHKICAIVKDCKSKSMCKIYPLWFLNGQTLNDTRLFVNSWIFPDTKYKWFVCFWVKAPMSSVETSRVAVYSRTHLNFKLTWFWLEFRYDFLEWFHVVCPYRLN